MYLWNLISSSERTSYIFAWYLENKQQTMLVIRNYISRFIYPPTKFIWYLKVPVTLHIFFYILFYYFYLFILLIIVCMRIKPYIFCRTCGILGLILSQYQDNFDINIFKSRLLFIDINLSFSEYYCILLSCRVYEVIF